jgi:4-hydroxybenzoyl-CoA reductase subunit beta
MMRCPPFAYHAPATVEEAGRILAAEGPEAMLLAGGTDLVPSMKRRTHQPRALVALRRIAGLREVRREGDSWWVGAGVTLSRAAADPRLGAHAALVRAAAQVATTHIRNTATVGGNLCLDTRCNYYDQGAEWRQAIGFCMKREGQTCWVAPGSPRCWAVSSTDLAPALVALGAEVRLVSSQGVRQLPLSALYHDDGVAYLTRRPDEILTEVRLPDASGWRSTYWKLRRREAFDFPVLGVAVAVKLGAGGVVEAARLVLGAVASHPLTVDVAAQLLGRPLGDDAIAAAAEAAYRAAKPMDNTDLQLAWRKRIARAFATGALRELRGDDPAALGMMARRAVGLRVMG